MTSSHEMNTVPDGLTRLKAYIKNGKPMGMFKILELNCIEVDKGHAVFEAVPDERFFNQGQIVHGGYAATLLDSACGSAVISTLPAGKSCTTINLNISYHKPLTAQSGRVYVKGQMLSCGQRVGFAAAEIVGVEDGRLYASATSSLLIIDA